jgi:hypothetical protein
MYKPILLGINDATLGDWLVLFGLALLAIIGVIALGGMIFYFTGYYIARLISQIRRVLKRGSFRNIGG